MPADELDGDTSNDNAVVPFDLIDATMDDPEIIPEMGTVWQIGPHVLIVGDVMKDWPLWSKYLNEGDWFVPYPSYFVPLAAKREPRLVMVQPETYLAGHIICKWSKAVPSEPARQIDQ